MDSSDIVSSWTSCVAELMPALDCKTCNPIYGEQFIMKPIMSCNLIRGCFSRGNVALPFRIWTKNIAIIIRRLQLVTGDSGAPLIYNILISVDSPTLVQIANKMDDIPNPNVTKELKSSKAGRYIVATDKIPMGAPIIGERAFTFVPIHGADAQHDLPMACARCARTRMPKPGTLQCPKCQIVQYCSGQCRQLDERIHRFECAGHRIGLWDLGIIHLAVRCFVAGICNDDSQELFQNYTANEDLETCFADVEADHSGSRYAEVLRLAHNTQDEAVRMQFAMTATMITEYFRNYTTLFNMKWLKAMSKIKADVLVGSLLLRHLGQMVNNAHAVYGFKVRPHVSNVPVGQLHKYLAIDIVGSAIFPRIAILNHSCDPNIRNRYEGDALIIHASREIAANEEVFNCYRPKINLQDQDERNKLQKQYGFACECCKCAEIQEQSKKRPLNVKSQKSDQVYICLKAECRAPNILDDTMRFWWHREERISIHCDTCGHTFETQWIGNGQMPMQDALLTYESNTKIMAKIHAQKTDACRMLLSDMGNHQPMSCECNRRLLSVAEDLMEAEAEQFGKLSLEFVAACVYWLDLAALLRGESYQFDEVYGCIVSKIAHISDVVEQVVASDIRTIFQNYCGNILGRE